MYVLSKSEVVSVATAKSCRSIMRIKYTDKASVPMDRKLQIKADITKLSNEPKFNRENNYSDIDGNGIYIAHR